MGFVESRGVVLVSLLCFLDGKILERQKQELEALEVLGKKKKEIEAKRYKLKFEEWLEGDAQKRIKEFEGQIAVLHPTTGEFALPAPVKLKKLREIQVDSFILENQVPTHLRELLLG